MSRDRIPSNPRVRAWFAVLAATGLTVIGLTQCRQVPETVTGVDITASSLGARDECVRACRDAYKDAVIKERGRHRSALEECGHDPACRRAEANRHVQIMQDLVADRRACKKDCYNEGSGKGGR